ncbi:uncharacterized protein MYCFIDRAFT_204040 [Pseudocercospora fijiensis CIRAD86]|uniref:Uncharacterized protein n=1 Tax=Pseudocercospora fijiensis (strain CIRAD86) TaxID=383855 RepID=M2YXT6_PSEFD|nr:uncharacterized protein MYCFIDRAFT_204040 [Pseudocercospora fijiensis CIRAD86]EME82505.1 hypothetical protein MYCFIDRAFT_204040 [Pseudocercospora fijiensis CIRAD86]
MALLDDPNLSLSLGHASQISACRKAASLKYGFPVKTPSLLQRQQNSGRGSIPGLIDPLSAHQLQWTECCQLDSLPYVKQGSTSWCATRGT